MTRQEIVNEYNVDERGCIRSPGKFEGEMVYAPYFYDLMLDGCADENTDGSCTVPIEKEDIDIFPSLAGIDYVKLYEDDNGFFYVSLYSKK